MSGHVACEFRLVCGASRDADRFLLRALLAAVPDRGEVVNLQGEPYVVHERGWALQHDEPTAFARVPLFCYLRVCSLQAPTRKAGE